MLSSRNRSEFLAVPELVRLSMPQGSDGREPTLLIKASALNLQYFLRLRQFNLIILLISGRWLGYGVELLDDAEHPAMLWSLLEYADELEALKALQRRSKCIVHLFNEIVVNIAWAEVSIDLRQDHLADVLQFAELHPTSDQSAAADVSAKLDGLFRGTIGPPEAYRVAVGPEVSWHELRNTYITNRASASSVSMFGTDEGGQQEEIALWLTDSIHPPGAVKNPLVHVPGRPARELCDLLFSYPNGAFLFESKSLAVLSRPTLPTREKLARDIVKDARRGVKQLSGALKNLRRGYRITAPNGDEISVEREKLPHVVVLVPDLELINDALDLGGAFIEGFLKSDAAFLHFLDPAELLRVVQAGEMLAARSSRLTPIECLDAYLVQRFDKAVTCPSPAMHILLKFADDDASIGDN